MLDLPRFVLTIMNNIAIEEITAIEDETINITKPNWPQSFLDFFMVSILLLFLQYSSFLSILLINMKELVSGITGANDSQTD